MSYITTVKKPSSPLYLRTHNIKTTKSTSINSKQATTASFLMRSKPEAPSTFALDMALIGTMFFLGSLFLISGTCALIGALGWVLSQFKFVRDFVEALRKVMVKDDKTN